MTIATLGGSYVPCVVSQSKSTRLRRRVDNLSVPGPTWKCRHGNSTLRKAHYLCKLAYRLHGLRISEDFFGAAVPSLHEKNGSVTSLMGVTRPLRPGNTNYQEGCNLLRPPSAGVG